MFGALAQGPHQLISVGGPSIHLHSKDTWPNQETVEYR